MANDFTKIIDAIYAKGLMALRQHAIMPRLVNTDYKNEVAKQGQVINVPIPSAQTVGDVVPSNVPPTGQDTTPSSVAITLDQWKKTDMFLTDKEAREVVQNPRDLQVSEAMKALCNFVDVYLFQQYKKVYGFAGTAGTTPFASDLSVATAARKTLGDQLAPMDPRYMILGTTAEANALNLASVQSAMNRRNADTLTTGEIGDLLGFKWFTDQNVLSHTSTPLSGGAATVNGAHAVNAGSTDNGRTGVVSIAKATATSPLVAGDIITFAGDLQTYTVVSDVTLAVGNTNVTISPALKTAKVGGEAVTLKASHVVNLAIHRDAFALAVRPLDAADGFKGGNEIRTDVDPITGLALTLEVSREYNRTKYQWSILFGAQCVRPELACRVAG